MPNTQFAKRFFEVMPKKRCKPHNALFLLNHLGSGTPEVKLTD